jgi:putative restriction endonuclease
MHGAAARRRGGAAARLLCGYPPAEVRPNARVVPTAGLSLAWSITGWRTAIPSPARSRGQAGGAGIPSRRRRWFHADPWHGDPADRTDFEIGRRILTQPFFLEERDWLRVPTSWSRNIVFFKTYGTGDAEALALWEAVQDRFGAPHLITPRLGQGALRVLVMDSYRRRCAVTREKTLPALEAAHIRPYAEGGAHEVSNGLLLRRDLHGLFDAGYVTVAPDLRFNVTRRIREEFDNSRHYDALHGQRIVLPGDLARRPDRAALTWHNENVFRG